MVIKKWNLSGVLSEIKKINTQMENRRFVFILGAGASIDSKIPSAAELSKRWLKQIYEREYNDQKDDFDKWLDTNPLDIIDWEINNLAKHYPTIFEYCFDGDHESGHSELEAAINKGEASFGYAVLAWLMSETRNNLAITTNFDNLLADSLAAYGRNYPHVIGHESLACFLKPISERPTIIKIHRDIFNSPINTNAEVSELNPLWVKPLKDILKFYTPIFIGYGGNDGSLMNFLNSLDKTCISGKPFWFSYQGNSTPVNEAVSNFLKKFNGILIESPAFDELMFHIGSELGYNRLKQKELVKLRSNKLLSTIDEQLFKLTENSAPSVKEKIVENSINLESIKNIKALNWLDCLIYIQSLKDQKLKGKLFRESLKYHPKCHQILNAYGVCLFLNNNLNQAMKYVKKALKLSPDNPDYLGNLGNALVNSHKFNEAENVFLKALEIAPNHVNNLGNYAYFLSEIGKKKEAESYYIKAIQIDPMHANNIESYACTLVRNGKLKEAKNYFVKALSIEPQNDKYLKDYEYYLSLVAKSD